MPVEHVVILTLENRSFDEYFGTYAAANGFLNSPRSEFDTAWVPSGGTPVLPFRLSTFTSTQGATPGCNHNWEGQHQDFDGGAMDGWPLSGTASPNPLQCMGYYVADDIPYHWWLAQNFTLCDNYFCSILANTFPNRYYLQTGKIDNQIGYTTNFIYTNDAPTWQTYADMLTAGGVSWRVYDAAGGTAPSDAQGTFDPGGDTGPGAQSPLDAFIYFPIWQTLQDSTNLVWDESNFPQFAADARDGNLPQVSWLFPQFGFSEHPGNTSADGALAISSVVEALLGSDAWTSTVLIINYDENDGHFDHVTPPVPTSSSQYPDEFIFDTTVNKLVPIGAGFRVPAIIVSPWTFNGGVCSDLFDHTSVLRFLHDQFGVACTNISSWRTDTFGSLSSTAPDGFVGTGVAANAVPARPDVAALAQNAISRRNSAPTLSNPVPNDQSWPVAQGCQLVLVQSSYSKDAVLSQAGHSTTATFQGAAFVTVDGFEPNELTTQYAIGEITQTTSQPPVTTRIPNVTVKDASGAIMPIEFTCAKVSPDPVQTVTQSGVPTRFTFTFDVTFTDFSVFGSAIDSEIDLKATAVFQVDTTVLSSEPLVLVTSEDPQFYQNFDQQVPYLSDEIKVFQVTSDDQEFNINVGTDPHQFMHELLQALNTSAQAQDGKADNWLDNLSGDESAAWLSLPINASGETIYNFAVARVHMEGLAQSENVGVFFRLFSMATTNTAYYSGYNYLSVPLPASSPPGLIAAPGVGWGAEANQYVSLPFFAKVRSGDPLTQTDPDNVRNIPKTVPSGGLPADGEVYEAFYGCWLDINVSPDPAVPQFGVPNGDAALQSGPWPSGTALISPNAWIRNLHQCLVAEICYYNEIVIPEGSTPGTSSWLAQRNLAFTPTVGG